MDLGDKMRTINGVAGLSEQPVGRLLIKRGGLVINNLSANTIIFKIDDYQLIMLPNSVRGFDFIALDTLVSCIATADDSAYEIDYWEQLTKEVENNEQTGQNSNTDR